MVKVGLLALLLVGMNLSVSAQTPSGITVQDGASSCKATMAINQGMSASAKEATDAALCLGTVIGVTNLLSRNCAALRSGQAAGSVHSAAFPTDPASLAIDAYVKWAAMNPQAANASFEDGMIDALVAAFPC